MSVVNLPGPHAGVFNLAAVVASEEVILCESLIDALTLWCCGFRHVTAAFGTEGFPDELRDALCGSGVRRVLVAFDADEAGDKAAGRVAAVLMAGGLECFRVELPRGADVNDVACQPKVPADALGRYLRKAAWMGAGPGRLIAATPGRSSDPLKPPQQSHLLLSPPSRPRRPSSRVRSRPCRVPRCRSR